MRAPSLRMRLVGWFGSEAENSLSENKASVLVWE